MTRNSLVIGVKILVKAYGLISTEPGQAVGISKKVEDIEGVQSVEAVAGPYDLVVIIEVNSLDKLTGTIFGKIRGVDGVSSTTTLIVVGLG